MIHSTRLRLLSIVLFVANAQCSNAPSSHAEVLYQFPNQTRIENLAVRSNGHLLLSLLTKPELLTLDPSNENPKPSAIYSFPNTTTLFGIAEVETDVFAVATGNLSLTFEFPPNNIAVWLVDIRKGIEEVQARKAASLPQGATLNGVAPLSRTKVLASDIGAGVVYAIDLNTGDSSIAIQDETMVAPAILPGYGINGIRTQDGNLYYMNIGKGLFCRVSVNPITGTATGAIQTISDEVRGGDDFALSKRASTAYVANVFEHELLEVKADGNVKAVVSGVDGTLTGPTSAQFGRTTRDWDVLYVVDSGSVFNPMTGGFDSVEGGKVVAVRLHS